MALIKCPECGGQVSDKAEVCIHCGYPLKKQEENSNNISDAHLYDKTKIIDKVESKYLNRDCWILSIKDEYDIFLQGRYIELYNDNNVLLSDTRINLAKSTEQTKEIYVWKNDKVNFNEIKKINIIDEFTRNKKEEILRKANSVNFSNQVKCPKCGSIQIQMVPRKWSWLTGFLTNKVDRVCMNCKHKF